MTMTNDMFWGQVRILQNWVGENEDNKYILNVSLGWDEFVRVWTGNATLYTTGVGAIKMMFTAHTIDDVWIQLNVAVRHVVTNKSLIPTMNYL